MLLGGGILEGQVGGLAGADGYLLLTAGGGEARVVGGIHTDDDGVEKVVPVAVGVLELEVEAIARHAGGADDGTCQGGAAGG